MYVLQKSVKIKESQYVADFRPFAINGCSYSYLLFLVQRKVLQNGFSDRTGYFLGYSRQICLS